MAVKESAAQRHMQMYGRPRAGNSGRSSNGGIAMMDPVTLILIGVGAHVSVRVTNALTQTLVLREQARLALIAWFVREASRSANGAKQ